jgi:AraC-like DNA-binding protein
MDVHIVPGVKAKDVAEAHRKDLLHQGEFECKCMTYWIDEERENIFCLIEAPDRQAVEEMHSRAHGLVPNKIIEVSSHLVESFLGRIYDPQDAKISDGLKVFSDPSFRTLLVTQVSDPILLQYKSGKEQALQWLNQLNTVVRKHLAEHNGREAEHSGGGFIISFESAAKAVSCALAIQRDIPAEDARAMGFRMALHAGEPVEKSNKLFGDTLQTARWMCSIAKNSQIAISSVVKELSSKDFLQDDTGNVLTLSPQDESLLASLFNKLEENWQNADFDVDDYCQAMTMSTSQLYRKTLNLTSVSPNILLKNFRLEKSRELMKKDCFTISQITFDCGFTSPSYFTKCFKKNYGLLPVTYLDLLH